VEAAPADLDALPELQPARITTLAPKPWPRANTRILSGAPVVLKVMEPVRRVMVRYRVKRERVAEHEALVRAVFQELAEAAPAGIRYAAFKQPDGVSFVHLAFVEAAQNPLQAIRAFSAFTAEIKERCDELPQTADLTAVGTYGF
jgi:hypothetical protein